MPHDTHAQYIHGLLMRQALRGRKEDVTMNLMGTTEPVDYGLNLTRYLEKVWDGLGTTRGAWSRQAGLADSTVLRWSQGVEPNMDNLRMVAEALNLKLTQVLLICGYITPGELKTATVPPPPVRPTVSEAIELDRTITTQEKLALRAMHDLFTQAADGHKRSVRIRSKP